ncbi:hypothetical protein [Legionella tunisiensis]|uniref:hypothetical protein n=1 Tax=Legionella tunisiensis TaxID=1034944 RepID=UPI0002F4C2CF|nr:hypothetical protein [Legionella tunisiensis]
MPTIAPQFPVIDVKKENPPVKEDKPLPPKAVSPGTEIGQTIAAALSPLIERLGRQERTARSEDKTAGLIHDLAREFEKKGDNA